jgi:ankyrin repeat protein
MSISQAANAGDLAEVERLVGQDSGLLNARGGDLAQTPLMEASSGGHVGVVRWLLDRGATIDEQSSFGCTALFLASYKDRSPVVRLLVERGADPTIASNPGMTPLVTASIPGHLETVRCLLAHPAAAATINRRDQNGKTALWYACINGWGDIVRLLLEKGADPTIPSNDGTTPVAVAKQDLPYEGRCAKGRRECVKALEVRFGSLDLPPSLVC